MAKLIQPVRKGRELAEEIQNAQPAEGSLVVWWLGQSGFVIKSRYGTMVIDPYLSEHLTKKYERTNKPHVRMTECPIRGDQLSGIDVILSSHKHSDHMDPGTLPGLLRASPNAELVVPEALVDHAISLGLPAERVMGLEVGRTYERAGFTVRAIPSAHEGLDKDEAGRHLYLGYVVEADGRRLYHSGDSMLYEGLDTFLGPGPFDVFFLPINGRDPSRGVAGNMSAKEAVALASRCRPRYLVPHHYEMFTFNTVPVGVFETAAAELPEGVRPQVLRCGERWEIRP